MGRTRRDMPVKKIATINIMGVLFFLCIAHVFVDSASAHGVIVFAWVQGDTVYVESKFSGGRKVRADKILVVDPQGKTLVSGLTDDQGEFSFKIPKRTDLKIVLVAGQGHRAEWTVGASEMTEPASKTVPENSTETVTRAERTEPVAKTTVETGTAATDIAIETKQLEAVIEKVLDRKLEPIYRMLADTRGQGPATKDILGGIGYILGLVGIVAYVQSRRKKG